MFGTELQRKNVIKNEEANPNFRYDPSRDPPLREASVGTTAEIYEYRDPPPESMEIGFKMKVKGRQRFKIISSRQQVDGSVRAQNFNDKYLLEH